jgi:hypothetical protein
VGQMWGYRSSPFTTRPASRSVQIARNVLKCRDFHANPYSPTLLPPIKTFSMWGNVGVFPLPVVAVLHPSSLILHPSSPAWLGKTYARFQSAPQSATITPC